MTSISIPRPDPCTELQTLNSKCLMPFFSWTSPKFGQSKIKLFTSLTPVCPRLGIYQQFMDESPMNIGVHSLPSECQDPGPRPQLLWAVQPPASCSQAELLWFPGDPLEVQWKCKSNLVPASHPSHLKI